jgi:pimeloyl-ACP methyl ester carboxylesterase
MATGIRSEPAVEGVALEHRHATVDDGVRLHYVEAGAGPLVVLLHGFPEFWYGWRHQIPALVEAGFRVVAPDQRGYAGSDKPSDWREYRIEILARDIDRLIAACGEERALVVGHDWGAAVAWALAMLHPERVERLAILNVPHPRRMLQGLRTARQLRKSWYMFWFQIPWLPEAAERASGQQFAKRAFAMARRPGAFTEEDIERYLAAMRIPGALTGMVAWYRAALRRTPKASLRLMRRIEAPTLVIWGVRDAALGEELAEPEPDWVPNARVVRLPEASHWVQHDEPERVNELLIEFLRGAL